MAPILQEQQELMATISYEPKQQYEHPPAKHAQPPPKLYIHPNSTVARLRLTPEEIGEVLAEQDRWYREEYQQEVEEDRARVGTEDQDQVRSPTPPHR